VVNLLWREQDSLVRSLQGKLNRQQCLFAAHTIRPETELDTDTVKMIAYRAETSMMQIVRESLAREDDSRSVVRDLLRTTADLSPDLERGELRVTVHPLSNPRSNRAVSELLTVLNATETHYPGTKLKLTFALIGSQESQKTPT